MKILITPEANTAETDGSITRTLAIAEEALKRGHEVAFCAAKDINFRKIDHVKIFPSGIPSPAGLPKPIGKLVYKLYKYSGLQKKEDVSDYEQIFRLIGLVSRKFFITDVRNVQKAILEFKPDIIFTEHRLSPIVAAKLENIPVATTYSYPIHESFHSKNYGRYSKHVRRIISEMNLPPVKSFLDLYNWVDLKLVPNIYELEPIDTDRLFFVGFLLEKKEYVKPSGVKKNIIVYLGNSGMTGKEIINAFTKAFIHTEYDVYISSKEMTVMDNANIHVDKRLDFSKLLPDTAVFFSHGGQNSIMEAFINGVPLAVFPGGLRERQYNADITAKNKAGIRLDLGDFSAENLKNIVRQIERDDTYSKNAKKIGQQLIKHGGASKVIDLFEEMINSKSKDRV